MLPASAIAVVAFTVLVSARPKPVVAVRLRGGPTEGATVLSWRLEVVERLGSRESVLAGRAASLEARFDGGGADWHGTLDAEGAASVTLAGFSSPVSGSVRVRVSVANLAPLPETVFAVSRARWSAHARRRGGWVEGRPSGDLSVRVAPGRGIFAVPFRDPLWVEVRGPNAALDGVTVSASAEGGRLVGTPRPPLVSRRSELFFTPDEYAVDVSVVAHSPTENARLDVALDVDPGALHAVLSPDGLVVSSPIVRERAYVAIVTESERLTGGTVTLIPDGSGGARGLFALGPLPREPTWAVVSSESDRASPALVGWPIVTSGTEPPMTFDVPDVLLADTTAVAVGREASRVRCVRALAASFAVFALALTAWFVARDARRARAELRSHLDDAGADAESTIRIATSGGASNWVLALSLLVFALAALLVATFALYR